MEITAHHTHAIQAGESIIAILNRYLPPLMEGDIVAITSKILSLCENQVIPKAQVPNKQALIEQEADAYLMDGNGNDDNSQNRYGVFLTIKNGILIPSAGIDESNVNEAYLLYPRDIQGSLTQIWNFLRERDHIKQLGLILTDSHTTPLRRGTTGIGLGWCGFEALRSYIGKPDIFGRPLKVSVLNLLDSLASAAVLVMGEGAEQTPLALIRQASNILFQDQAPAQDELNAIAIPLEDDLYAPILKQASWSRA